MLDGELRDLFDELFDKLGELNNTNQIEYDVYEQLYDMLEAIEHACENREF